MPGGGERTGFRLAVSDHTRDDQIRVVECGTVGVRKGIAELTALVNRPGRFRRRVTGNSAWKRELPKQLAQSLRILLYRWIDFAIGSFQISIRHHPGTAVTGSADIYDIQVT